MYILGAGLSVEDAMEEPRMRATIALRLTIHVSLATSSDRLPAVSVSPLHRPSTPSLLRPREAMFGVEIDGECGSSSCVRFGRDEPSIAMTASEVRPSPWKVPLQGGY
jgi:hypothetical protein